MVGLVKSNFAALELLLEIMIALIFYQCLRGGGVLVVATSAIDIPIFDR